MQKDIKNSVNLSCMALQIYINKQFKHTEWGEIKITRCYLKSSSTLAEGQLQVTDDWKKLLNISLLTKKHMIVFN